MRITIFGAGYVGLVTGACLADTGVPVSCVDVNEDRIDRLSAGEAGIYEPGLGPLLEENLAAGRIEFTTQPRDPVEKSEIIMITVGTPSTSDGEADLNHIFEVSRTIGDIITDYKLIVQKSTAPVGTCRRIRETIQARLEKRKVAVDFSVASNPEFLKEGNAVEDFLKPDRIILGVDNGKDRHVLERLYKPFMRKKCKTIFMGVESAEMSKYAANCMLASRISFMNMLSWLAETVGADIEEVRTGIGTDPRIGEDFLYAGAGYGGSCFPKDVRALAKTLQEHGLDAGLPEAVERINCQQKERFAARILAEMGKEPADKVVALWGVAFKAGTDDVREAPSIHIARRLMAHGVTVKIFDPQAMGNFKNALLERGYPLPRCGKNEYDILPNADALVILNEWHLFRNPDLQRIKELMRSPTIFDGRNLLDPTEVKQSGFVYYSIGRT